jgi:toxin ParE1/3/4
VKYTISEKANEDINNIWLYTFENWSQEQADRYYNLIMEEIEFVAQNFESGKSMEHIRVGYRAAKVKSHIIFYRKSQKNVVEIIRILHQRMDIENHLN